MVLTGEGTNLRHVVEGEIDLTDATIPNAPIVYASKALRCQ